VPVVRLHVAGGSLTRAAQVFNNSALFSAIPRLKEDMGMTESDATWLISAYQLTFASFLLIAGKISDVYDPSARPLLLLLHTTC
jgi:MFS family permease